MAGTRWEAQLVGGMRSSASTASAGLPALSMSRKSCVCLSDSATSLEGPGVVSVAAESLDVDDMNAAPRGRRAEPGRRRGSRTHLSNDIVWDCVDHRSETDRTLMTM